MTKGGVLVLLFLTLTLLSLALAQKECPNAPSSPQDRRTNKDSLVIATYNAEWLFLNRSNCPGTFLSIVLFKEIPFAFSLFLCSIIYFVCFNPISYTSTFSSSAL
jgi:hypothetical protein